MELHFALQGEIGVTEPDDPAVGDRAAAALFDHAIQFTPQGFKVGDLAIDLGAMLPSNAVDRLAGPFSLSDRVSNVRTCSSEKPTS